MSITKLSLLITSGLLAATLSLHTAAQQEHSHGDGAAHSHGDDTHTHENAPETEEFFGDTAEQADSPHASHEHGANEQGHGSDNHSHDEHQHAAESHAHTAETEGQAHAHPHE